MNASKKDEDISKNKKKTSNSVNCLKEIEILYIGSCCSRVNLKIFYFCLCPLPILEG